jgi:hypothetical protein
MRQPDKDVLDAEIAAVIARIDDALHMHDRYVALRAAVAASKPATPVPPRAEPAGASKPDEGLKVLPGHPAPVQPSPAAHAAVLPHAMARRAVLAALRSDEIKF